MSGRNAKGSKNNGNKRKGRGSASKLAWCCSVCVGGDSKPFRNKAGTAECAKCSTKKGQWYGGPAYAKAQSGAAANKGTTNKDKDKEIKELKANIK